MAFGTKSVKFLAGSLNLVVPPDKIPAGDACAGVNWRVDAQGMLRSRLREGATAVNFNSPIASLWLYEANPVRRYVGDLNTLWRVTNGVVSGIGSTDGLPIGFANYQGYTWVLNRSIVGRDNGTTPGLITWIPAPPALPLTATPVAPTPPVVGLTGSYNYYYSFFTADGFESDVSPPSLVVVDAAQVNDLGQIGISTDPSVTGRYIYRDGGTETNLYQVAILNDNVTTVLPAEGMTDLAAANLGIVQTLDHQAPPPASGMGGPYYDHLCSWNSLANPNRWWWTKLLEPGYWPGALLSAGNWVDVGDDGEQILWSTFHPNFAVIYKERSVWRLRGDPDSNSSSLECISPDIGLLGVRAICRIGLIDYFQGAKGLYGCDGDQVRIITHDKLDPLFRGDALNYALAGQNPALPINTNPAVRALAVMGSRAGILSFSYADAANGAPNLTLTLDTNTGRYLTDSRAFTCLYDEGANFNFAGAYGGSVYNLEANLTGFPGVAVQYTSLFDDQGTPRNVKLYGDLEIEQGLAPGDSLAVTALYDFGLTTEVLGTLLGSGARTQVFPYGKGDGTRAKNHAVMLTGTLLNVGLVHGFHLHYELEQRDALTFDTTPTQLFDGAYGQALEFEIECQSAGAITWTMTTDTGGSAGGTAALSASSTRQTLQIPFGHIVEGRVFRLLLTSPVPFQLYALRLYVRRLGVYIPPGGLFTTRELDVSSKRVKLFRKIEFDAEIDATLTPSISTDAPTAWGVRSVQAIGTNGARRWTELLMPSNTRGRYLRIDAVSSGATRLYAGKIWYKAVGEAAPSEWSWAPIPLEPSEEIFRWMDIPVDRASA